MKMLGESKISGVTPKDTINPSNQIHTSPTRFRSKSFCILLNELLTTMTRW